MKARYLLATAVVAGGAFLALQPARAADIPVVWTFNQPPGDIGTTHTYGSNPTVSPPQNITATAFGPGSPHLFGKNAGPVRPASASPTIRPAMTRSRLAASSSSTSAV